MPSRYLALVGFAGLLAAGPAAAQSAGSAIDQPTAGTLPAGTSTVKGADGADRATGRVAPPSALAPSTDVMADGKGGGGTVDPVEHLPDSMRRTK